MRRKSHARPPFASFGLIPEDEFHTGVRLLGPVIV